MDIEEMAWKAFKLSGSIEAYLLAKNVGMLSEKKEDSEWKKQTDL